MKSIAVDMDQVLADFLGKASRACKERFNLSISKEEFDVAKLEAHHPELVKKFFLMINEPDFFRDLELLDPDAISVLKELSEHYEIYIATAAMDVPGCFNAKYEWLLEHFSFLNPEHFIFCGDKKVVKADYLIDDNVKQLHSFTGEGILYSQPYNECCEDFKRVRNWKEIRDLFLPVIHIND
ncbi:5' nucleotidase, NT5C type [Ureibacillus chungkukjangi]|uniref:5'(3')-deoxyribonucleotidase n=1 Tax=Ureibacillus chungkukjangi TaxID=1202712 RepID=A0A318TCC4_9BACL|nr:5'-3'-deoxyribonucleotidase [Ureibacillus chungkukjangi]MCM3390022.1 5'-3'-deoxyribonucleotidase [Ureibacillus chungkukjangi]PYF02183.1 5'(3')-deoxyribonucleotidase [Ureibacillus chungkukjangi]